jgi:hypothetical protein
MMPLTTGRYADSGRPPTLRSRLFWLRHNLSTFLSQLRGNPSNLGEGQYLSREWGTWMVRPCKGFRSRQWISPPLHATRSIPVTDHDAAIEWWMNIGDNACATE